MTDDQQTAAPAAETSTPATPATSKGTGAGGKRAFAGKGFQPPPPPVIDAEPAEPANEQGIAKAAAVLKAGGLVAFPTETVYGLGADASNPIAVAKIFKVKGRPQTHPLIVHIASAEQLGDWAAEVPEEAEKLAAAFWPGPLTMVLKRKKDVLDAVTGGQNTVALRVPAHPAALALLQQCDLGVAGPSANRFGRISPTTAEHVRADLGREVDLVLDGGACDVGIESTIVDLSRLVAAGAGAGDDKEGNEEKAENAAPVPVPVLLRPGRIRAEDIAKVLGIPALAAPDAEAPRAPGSLESHYAPKAALKIVKRFDFTDELAQHKGRRIGIVALEISVPRVAPPLQRVLPASASLYAQGIYAKLRELDDLHCDLILVEAPPKTAQWDAVWDRIGRAQHAHAHGVRVKAVGAGAGKAAAAAGSTPPEEAPQASGTGDTPGAPDDNA